MIQPVNEQRIPTTCTLDCPDTCALDVVVREGRVIALHGRRDHPDTAGFICEKVGRFHERLYHPSRILQPLRRTGPKGEGQFEAIGWDAALDEIARRFREVCDRFGAEAILPFNYGGSNGFLGDGPIDQLFFARLGASRLAKTFCAAPTGEVTKGMYGKMPTTAFEDFVHARCIIIWGANPRISNIHLLPYLKEARRRGAFIAVVDPLRTFPAGDVDLHLPILPGTDLPLALALAHEAESKGWLDRTFLAAHTTGADTLLAAARAWDIERTARVCGIDPGVIRRLAEAYQQATPALIRCGWGLERNQNGGRAVAAILALPALYGKFGMRGGGYALSNSGAVKLDVAKLFEMPPWTTRELNMSRLGSLLREPLTPPVAALYVYNCNPVATSPDQNAVIAGLQREDLFTVVHEQVMTDTARHADLVLPAVTFLEQHEVKRGYGSYVVGGVRPVVAAQGEARPNEAVFAALATRLGFKDEAFTWDTETLVRRIAGALTGIEGQAQTYLEGGLQTTTFEGGPPVQFSTVMPRTEDARGHLAPTLLGNDPFGYDAAVSEGFPLALLSPASSKMTSSTFGEFNYPELRLAMNSADAATRGIRQGDLVQVWNELGEVQCPVDLTDQVRPGVVVLPKGAWMKASRNGRTATALAPAHLEPTSGGACYNDARVEVARLGPS